MSDFQQQPQQQASKPQRLRTQLPSPTLGLGQDFGMQPDPDIPQDQGHADKRQPQDRIPAAGADAR